MASHQPIRLIYISCLWLLGGFGCSGTDETGDNDALGGAAEGAGAAGELSASGGASWTGAGGVGGLQPAGGTPSGGASATGGGGPGSGGFQGLGGSVGSGGVVVPAGGTTGSGGLGPASGGVPSSGGMAGSGGFGPGAGASSLGGDGPVGGASMGGGSSPVGGFGPVSGGGPSGGSNVGGAATGGEPSTGGAGGSGGSLDEGCSFIADSSRSSAIPTVGIVEWSTDLADVVSAQIVYALNGAGANVLNAGGVAPVDLEEASHRTLLLGLKGQSTYTFHIEATSSNGTTCTSEDYELTTGAVSGAPQITRTGGNAAAQAKGFIVTCGGLNSNGPAIIIDADGDVVWWAAAPRDCGRARMDYEGKNLWMGTLNAQNLNGEMRRVSMDGTDVQNNVSGLSRAHHDFTVVPGGIVAVLAWRGGGTDVESDLLERAPDGTVTTAFGIGSNVYAGGPSELGAGSNTYHANSIQYYAADDSYTIGDRNPNMFVKVTRSGTPVWQLGGNCSGAPAPRCATADWDVNHGHHLLDDGTFVLFSNGPFFSSVPSRAHVFTLNTSGNAMTATEVHSYASSTNAHSDSLGDVQRLPNGNTLVVFSNTGLIEELDPSWNVVQSLRATSFGYADWRETLYGPPAR